MRRFRRRLGFTMLAFISVGSIYLLTSVGVTIYRRRNVDSEGLPAGVASATVEDVTACHAEVGELFADLDKHLESFHRLLGGYDADVAREWSEEGVRWKRRWREARRRCRFGVLVRGPLSRELDALGVAHAELGETEAIYTEALQRFGKEQAPRLDRVRDRLHTIAARLEAAGSPHGETPP